MQIHLFFEQKTERQLPVGILQLADGVQPLRPEPVRRGIGTVRVDRLPVTFHRGFIVFRRFQQPFHLQAVDRFRQQFVQRFQQADVVGAHDMRSVFVFKQRHFQMRPLLSFDHVQPGFRSRVGQRFADMAGIALHETAAGVIHVRGAVHLHLKLHGSDAALEGVQLFQVQFPRRDDALCALIPPEQGGGIIRRRHFRRPVQRQFQPLLPQRHPHRGVAELDRVDGNFRQPAQIFVQFRQTLVVDQLVDRHVNFGAGGVRQIDRGANIVHGE
jgi:hypothetical protein